MKKIFWYQKLAHSMRVFEKPQLRLAVQIYKKAGLMRWSSIEAKNVLQSNSSSGTSSSLMCATLIWSENLLSKVISSVLCNRTKRTASITISQLIFPSIRKMNSKLQWQSWIYKNFLCHAERAENKMKILQWQLITCNEVWSYHGEATVVLIKDLKWLLFACCNLWRLGLVWATSLWTFFKICSIWNKWCQNLVEIAIFRPNQGPKNRCNTSNSAEENFEYHIIVAVKPFQKQSVYGNFRQSGKKALTPISRNDDLKDVTTLNVNWKVFEWFKSNQDHPLLFN